MQSLQQTKYSKIDDGGKILLMLQAAMKVFSQDYDPNIQGMKQWLLGGIESRIVIRNVMGECAFNSAHKYAFRVIEMFPKVWWGLSSNNYVVAPVGGRWDHMTSRAEEPVFVLLLVKAYIWSRITVGWPGTVAQCAAVGWGDVLVQQWTSQEQLKSEVMTTELDAV